MKKLCKTSVATPKYNNNELEDIMRKPVGYADSTQILVMNVKNVQYMLDKLVKVCKYYGM